MQEPNKRGIGRSVEDPAVNPGKTNGRCTDEAIFGGSVIGGTRGGLRLVGEYR